MKKSAIYRLFYFIYDMYFNKISSKFRPGSMKKSFDILYVIFEKFAFKFTFISNIYPRLYYEIVKKEVDMANIQKNDKVLVIGCGSLPITPEIIAKITKAKITALDIDKKAVNNAKKYFKNKNLDRYISVKLANGLNYPINEFNIIFVLQGVQNQKTLLPSLSKNMENDTIIIFRSLIEGYNESLKDFVDLNKYFIVEDKIKSDILNPVGSYLLKKKYSN